jgi:hypothetical protein
MAPFDPRALRQIIRYLDETAAAGYHRDPAVAYRLGVMSRRASVRVAAAAGELAAAAGERDAPAELRSLAAAVRKGETTWERCVTGKADDVPEVRAWHATTERRARAVPVQREDVDDDEGIGPILRRWY